MTALQNAIKELHEKHGYVCGTPQEIADKYGLTISQPQLKRVAGAYDYAMMLKRHFALTPDGRGRLYMYSAQYLYPSTIAGGSVARIFNGKPGGDVDVYDNEARHSSLARQYRTRTTKAATHINHPELGDIQLIMGTMYDGFHVPANIFPTYDFATCCMAYVEGLIVTKEQAIIDIKENKVSLNDSYIAIKYADQYLGILGNNLRYRIDKYSKNGYNVSCSSIIQQLYDKFNIDEDTMSVLCSGIMFNPDEDYDKFAADDQGYDLMNAMRIDGNVCGPDPVVPDDDMYLKAINLEFVKQHYPNLVQYLEGPARFDVYVNDQPLVTNIAAGSVTTTTAALGGGGSYIGGYAGVGLLPSREARVRPADLAIQAIQRDIMQPAAPVLGAQDDRLRQRHQQMTYGIYRREETGRTTVPGEWRAIDRIVVRGQE